MRITTTIGLPEQAREIRTEVFVQEQGFREEFDTLDDKAQHILLWDGDHAVATCRILTGEGGYYLIGRIAVRRAYRGKQIGAELMRAAEQEIIRLGGREIRVHAQCRAQEFYRKQGYQPFGVCDEEDGCPHVWMRKTLIP